MKFKTAYIFAAFVCILLLPERGICSGNPSPIGQDEWGVTQSEREEVKAFAQRFVARLLKTRDLHPLIAEFFLPNFTDFWEPESDEDSSPTIWASLKRDERVRLFVAVENFEYFLTVDRWSRPQGDAYFNEPAFKRTLPASIVRKLNRFRRLQETAEFKKRSDLMQELIRLEAALRQARRILARRDLEASSNFLKKLHEFEREPDLGGYRVRGNVLETTSAKARSHGLVVGQKAFRVEIPIMMGLFVLKHKGKLKIVWIEPPDD